MRQKVRQKVRKLSVVFAAVIFLCGINEPLAAGAGILDAAYLNLKEPDGETAVTGENMAETEAAEKAEEEKAAAEKAAAEKAADEADNPEAKEVTETVAEEDGVAEKGTGEVTLIDGLNLVSDPTVPAAASGSGDPPVSIAAGQIYDGMLTAGEIHTFQLTVPYKAVCTIKTQSNVGQTPHLYNADSIEISTFNNYNGGIRMGKPLLEAGTYYVKLSGPSGSYSISYTIDTLADAADNSIAEATEIGAGQEHEALLNFAGDIDYFKITVPYKAECTIRTHPPLQARHSSQLYD